MDYGQGLTGGTTQVMQQMLNQQMLNRETPKCESRKQKLQRQLGEAEYRVASIKEALDILDRNVDMDRFLTLMGEI